MRNKHTQKTQLKCHCEEFFAEVISAKWGGIASL